MVAPLTKITSSQVIFKGIKIKHDAFYEIKRIMDWDNLSTYPDFNEEFKIHTDASDFGFVAVIRKKSKPIAFYGIKSTSCQIMYRVT